MAIDCVADTLETGYGIRVLTVGDAFTRERRGLRSLPEFGHRGDLPNAGSRRLPVVIGTGLLGPHHHEPRALSSRLNSNCEQHFQAIGWQLSDDNLERAINLRNYIGSTACGSNDAG
jgi:hypothetical protein